jgi:hypothetical protein
VARIPSPEFRAALSPLLDKEAEFGFYSGYPQANFDLRVFFGYGAGYHP